MLKKIPVIILLFCLLALSTPAMKSLEKAPGSAGSSLFLKEPEPEIKSFRHIGEKITYDVRLGSLLLGRAVFEHLPAEEFKGAKVNAISFKTQLARFKDVEKILSDPLTNLPLFVDRSVSTWPLPEQITEEYDQQGCTVVIKKKKGGKLSTVRIKKELPLNNAILLPYYVRDIEDLEVGWSMKVQLPTQQYEIKLVSIEQAQVPAGIFKAYRFKSTPDKFEIWLSADESRIPLKIRGMGSLGYNLAMREYSKN